MANIRIENLRLHIKGLSARQARAVLDGLGEVVLQALAEDPHFWQTAGALDLTRLRLNPIRPAPRASSGEVRRQVAAVVAGAILEAAAAAREPRAGQGGPGAADSTSAAKETIA